MGREDLSDVYRELRQLKRDVQRLKSTSMLENSSISDGRLRMIRGQILIENGNLTVDGSVPIKLHQQNGAARIDFGTNAYMLGIDNAIAMTSAGGAGLVTMGPDSAAIAGEAGSVTVDDTGVRVAGTGLSGSTTRYLGINAQGYLVALSPGGGGDPGDPPAGNPDGYVWPVDPAVYGISATFTDHQNRTPPSQEPGVDVPCPVGTAVWSPGPGTVTEVQTSPAGATGRYVTFVTDAGDWFRMLHNSSVVVSPGQHVEQGTLLAYSGGSGFGSEAYYGPHSHISFKQGYTGSFPGASALDDFEAYMEAA